MSNIPEGYTEDGILTGSFPEDYFDDEPCGSDDYFLTKRNERNQI